MKDLLEQSLRRVPGVLRLPQPGRVPHHSPHGHDSFHGLRRVLPQCRVCIHFIHSNECVDNNCYRYEYILYSSLGLLAEFFAHFSVACNITFTL
jgi:hypothetical protein